MLDDIDYMVIDEDAKKKPPENHDPYKETDVVMENQKELVRWLVRLEKKYKAKDWEAFAKNQNVKLRRFQRHIIFNGDSPIYTDLPSDLREQITDVGRQIIIARHYLTHETRNTPRNIVLHLIETYESIRNVTNQIWSFTEITDTINGLASKMETVVVK